MYQSELRDYAEEHDLEEVYELTELLAPKKKRKRKPRQLTTIGHNVVGASLGTVLAILLSIIACNYLALDEPLMRILAAQTVTNAALSFILFLGVLFHIDEPLFTESWKETAFFFCLSLPCIISVFCYMGALWIQQEILSKMFE